MNLFIILLAAIALTAAPALAQSPRTQYHPYGHGYLPGSYGGGWVSRPAGGWIGPPVGAYWGSRAYSDPSHVSPGYLREKALGRCVQDLGYGRYEYC